MLRLSTFHSQIWVRRIPKMFDDDFWSNRIDSWYWFCLVVRSWSVDKLRPFGVAIASVETVVEMKLCSVQKSHSSLDSQAIYSLIGFANFDTMKSDCLSPEQNTHSSVQLGSQETMFDQFRNGNGYYKFQINCFFQRSKRDFQQRRNHTCRKSFWHLSFSARIPT